MSATRKDLEKDFEDFLNFCEKQKFTPDEFRKICKPLVATWRWQFWRRVAYVLAAATFVWWLCSNVEVISWTSSAIGRLVLIELLPFWNWTPLHNAKCLVDRSVPRKIDDFKGLGRYETERANCVLCEKFEFVSSLSNVTYSLLEQMYLEKGLPVIINDSHSPQTLGDFLKLMLTDQEDLLKSDPCDLETNLLLKKFFTIGAALEKITESSQDDEWFLQMRNCRFKAVKASRRFIKRPYYYPVHFEPFYSSWVLISNNYAGAEKELYVHGLVLVQQLSGEVAIRLVPKSPCEKLCLDVKFVLKAGECVAFSTDLWIFNYQSIGGLQAITTMVEIDWRY